MDVDIFVESTFDDRETKKRNIGRLRRVPDEFGSEHLGLLLEDAKSLLRRFQEMIVQDLLEVWARDGESIPQARGFSRPEGGRCCRLKI